MDHVMSKMKKHMTRRTAWIIAGFVLLLLCCYYYFYLLPYSRLVAPVDDQLEAIRIEDNATAYSFTSNDFQAATSLEAFINFIKQYSSLRNNESITINSRQIENGIGKVKAVLISRGGAETPITYQLVQENDHWKIKSMILAPQGDDDSAADTKSTASQTQDTAAQSSPAASTTTSTQSANTYKDTNNSYSLIYPEGWQYTNANNGKVVFNGQAGSESSMSSFTIFSLGGPDNSQSVQEISDHEEALIKQQAGAFKVDDDGLLPPHSNKNERYHGKYTVYSYTVNDQQIKQLQVIYFITPKHALYVIDFVAPAAQFETDLPAAKAMIASFAIS